MLVVNAISTFNEAKEQVLKLQEENSANLSKNKRLKMASDVGSVLSKILLVCSIVALHTYKELLVGIFGIFLMCLAVALGFFANIREHYIRER